MDKNNSFIVQVYYPEDTMIFKIRSEQLSSPKSILFIIELPKINTETINRRREKYYDFDTVGQTFHEKFLKLPTLHEYKVKGIINFKISIKEQPRKDIVQVKRTFSPRTIPLPVKYASAKDIKPEINSITGAVQSKIFRKLSPDISQSPLLIRHKSPVLLKKASPNYSSFPKPNIEDNDDENVSSDLETPLELKDDSSNLIFGSPKKVSSSPPPLGLVNKGATCYMNSFLQALFHLHAFRSLVYSADSGDGETGSMVLAMQRLFASLERGSSAGDTGELMRSFGWGADDVYTQNDIQEFANVLMDALEKRLKKSPALADSFADFFCGETETTITCLDAPITNRRREVFSDISLTVEGCHSLRESLEAYTHAEELTGDNKYNGEHDAEMRTTFAKLPRVLQLHLQRFSFGETGVRKINSYFAFESELDMAPFVSETFEAHETRYRLFGVFVHSGCSSGGHYYSFLHLSDGPGGWFKFNDSLVTPASEGDAIVRNFGGSAISPSLRLDSSDALSQRQFSAYMLMYIRVDALPEMYGPLTAEIPELALEPPPAVSVLNSPKYQREFRVCCYGTITEAAQRGCVGLCFEEYPRISMGSDQTAADLAEETKRRFPEEDGDDLRIWGCGPAGPSAKSYPMEKKLSSITSDVIATTTVDSIFVLVYLYLPAYSHPVKFFSFLECDSTSVGVGMIMRNIREGIPVGESVEIRAYAKKTSGTVFPLEPQDRLSSKGIAHGDSLVFEFSDTSLMFDELGQPDLPTSSVIRIMDEPHFHPDTFDEFEEALRTEVKINILRPDSDRRCDRYAVPRKMLVSDFLSFAAVRQGIPSGQNLLLFGKGARFPVSVRKKMTIDELDGLFPGGKTFFIIAGETEEIPKPEANLFHREDSESELSCEDSDEKESLVSEEQSAFAVYFSPRPFVARFVGRLFLPGCKAGKLFEAVEDSGFGNGERAVAIDGGAIASFLKPEDELDWRYGVYRIDAYRTGDEPMVQVVVEGALIGRGSPNATPGPLDDIEEQPFLFPVIEGEQARDFRRRLSAAIAEANPSCAVGQPPAAPIEVRFKDMSGEFLDIRGSDMVYPAHNVNTILVYVTKETQLRQRGIVIK